MDNNINPLCLIPSQRGENKGLDWVCRLCSLELGVQIGEKGLLLGWLSDHVYPEGHS